MDMEPDAEHGPEERPSVDVVADGGGIRLQVRGRLDGPTADLLAALLRSARDAETEVVAVDVRAVTGFTDQGVQVLAASLTTSRSGRPKVRYSAGSPTAMRLLLAAATASR